MRTGYGIILGFALIVAGAGVAVWRRQGGDVHAMLAVASPSPGPVAEAPAAPPAAAPQTFTPPKDLPALSGWLHGVADTPLRRRLSPHLGHDALGEFLLAAFLAGDAATPPDAAIRERLLAYVKEHPEGTRALVAEGLQRLPKSDEFSVERAGLLDFLRIAEVPYRQARDIYIGECRDFPAPARPRPEQAASEVELNRALSGNVHTLRVLLAAENLIAAAPAADLAVEDMTEILASQKDFILQKTVVRSFRRHYPALVGDLAARAGSAGVPQDVFL